MAAIMKSGYENYHFTGNKGLTKKDDWEDGCNTAALKFCGTISLGWNQKDSLNDGNPCGGWRVGYNGEICDFTGTKGQTQEDGWEDSCNTEILWFRGTISLVSTQKDSFNDETPGGVGEGREGAIMAKIRDFPGLNSRTTAAMVKFRNRSLRGWKPEGWLQWRNSLIWFTGN